MSKLKLRKRKNNETWNKVILNNYLKYFEQ